MSTLIWAGRRSIPETVNSRFVVFVFRSLIMCPNFPERVLDSSSSSLLSLSSYILFCSSASFSFSLLFSKRNLCLSYSYLSFLCFYSIYAFSRSCYYLILLFSRTLVVLGSMMSTVCFGRLVSVKSIGM